MKNRSIRGKQILLSVRLQKLHRITRGIEKISKSAYSQLIREIRGLFTALSEYISRRKLIKVAGALAVYLGISSSGEIRAQQFAAPQQNPFGFTPQSFQPVNYPVAADIDGDGDLDLLSVDYYNTGLVYRENSGSSTSPNYDSLRTGIFGFQSAAPEAFNTICDFVDIDDDGDLDIIATYGTDYYGTTPGATYFHENVGTKNSPNFRGPGVKLFDIPGQLIISASFKGHDIDNDGDLDLIGTSYSYSGSPKTTFYLVENSGTKTNYQFGNLLASPYGLVTAQNKDVYTLLDMGDIDGDGDLDLITDVYVNQGSYLWEFHYHENTGTKENPSFAARQINPFGLRSTPDLTSPQLVDIDDDGDLDIISGNYYGNLMLFRNDQVSSIGEDAENFGISMYPNPTTDFIEISTTKKITKFEVKDLLGKSHDNLQIQDNRIDVSKLATGVYILNLSVNDSKAGTFRFVKE